ncbi:MAG TPA: 30S ribosomal protein S2, partial [Saprospiraceae bacterium]|nr:30S ribosomal protein S2 [Saprospiraceae bacterium]
NIKTFGMVDTNSDPTLVDFPIPSNDDASKAIAFITNYLAEAIREGLEERKAIKGSEKDETAAAEA